MSPLLLVLELCGPSLRNRSICPYALAQTDDRSLLACHSAYMVRSFLNDEQMEPKALEAKIGQQTGLLVSFKFAKQCPELVRTFARLDLGAVAGRQQHFASFSS